MHFPDRGLVPILRILYVYVIYCYAVTFALLKQSATMSSLRARSLCVH